MYNGNVKCKMYIIDPLCPFLFINKKAIDYNKSLIKEEEALYFTGRKFRVFCDFCPFSRKFNPRKKCFRLLAKVNPTRNVLKCGFAKVKLEKKNQKFLMLSFRLKSV